MRKGPEFEKAIYGEIFAAALPYLQTRHNEVHTLVSYGFGLRLLAGEGGDPDVVIPAILLHDVGWSQVPEERQLAAFGPNVSAPELTRLHEEEGARIAGEILERLGCPDGRRKALLEIVRGHDTRLTALDLNDMLVKDADKLFRISHEGFPIDCARFGLDPARHLRWLEARVESWFFTETGKRLAREEAQARWGELEAREAS